MRNILINFFLISSYVLAGLLIIPGKIENVMAEMAKITVGTFNKTVAERLAEINLAQDKSLTNLFTKTLSQTITSKAAFQATKVSESSLKYTTTGTSGAIIGF